MEDVLTREYVELTDEQQFPAPGTSFIAIHGHETRFKFLDVFLDLIGAVGCILHILSKLVYFDTISFESAADFILDGIQGRERREIWQDVFDLEQRRLFQELNGTVAKLSEAQTQSKIRTDPLISFRSSITYLAIFSHSFPLSSSSSSGLSALILASSRSPFSSAKSTLHSYNRISE